MFAIVKAQISVEMKVWFPPNEDFTISEIRREAQMATIDYFNTAMTLVEDGMRGEPVDEHNRVTRFSPQTVSVGDFRIHADDPGKA